jgi:hypothetical protein
MRACLLALGLFVAVCSVTACKEPAAPAPSPQNVCLTEESCPRRTVCDSNLYACVRREAEEPYQLALRVSGATLEGTMLADAGIQLVPEVVTSLGELTGERDAEILRVPALVPVPGQVSATIAGGVELLESQVTISARDAAAPMAPSVLDTRHPTSNPRDGGPPHLRAMLDPSLLYDVHVQPVLGSGATLPPLTRERVKASASEPIIIAYPNDIEAKTGRFLYRGDRPLADRVRLEDRETGRIVSSTGLVQTSFDADGNPDGRFTLHAERTVFEEGNFNLIVSVAGFDAWQVTITIEGRRFLSGGDIFLPAIPDVVPVSSSVKNEAGDNLAHVELVFVSRFPLPPPTEDPSPSVGGTDWCRWEDSARISCYGRFQTLSDENGQYQVELVPGEYDVFIVPREAEPNPDNLVVSQYPGDRLIVTVDNAGVFGPFVAMSGTPYTGTVLASGSPAPTLTVRALRRPTPPFSDWGDVANYNRNYSTVTDRKGQFKLLPDVGYYDFVVETAPSSGFPWKLWLDCPRGPEAGGALLPIELEAPVMVAGRVEHDGILLPNAKIEAFARVEGTSGAQRSVLIGRTMSDETGAYRLALPPRIGEETMNCEGRPVMDSER